MSAVWENAVEEPAKPMPSMWTPLEQLPWKFAGRVTVDDVELYAWTRANIWETDWHTIPVDEFWPKPTWKVSIREGSIIATLFGFLRGSTPQQRTFVNGVDAFTAVHPRTTRKATP
jgi:hypothetical protein